MIITVDSTTEIGTYHMNLNGIVAQANSAYIDLTITVEIVAPVNLGPPSFVGGLKVLSMKAGETHVYKLPDITDPDHDEY